MEEKGLEAKECRGCLQSDERTKKHGFQKLSTPCRIRLPYDSRCRGVRGLLLVVAKDCALGQCFMNGTICIRLVGRYPTIGLTSHLTESGRMGSGMCKHAFGGPSASLDLPNRIGVSIGVQRCA